MKKPKIITKIFVLALLFMASYSCQKNNTLFRAHFYTTVPDSEESYILLLNDQNRGVIPFNPTELSCTTTDLNELSLSFPLAPGRYKIVLINKQNKEVLRGNFKIKKNKMSSSMSGNGDVGTRIRQSGDCLLFTVKNN